MTETDPRTPDLATVASSYTSWAAAYIERFGSADLAHPEDRALIGGWADGLHGPVLDAGCGPGHWAAFLQARGVEVEGVDATAEFIAHARRTFPGIPVHVGDLRAPHTGAGSLGGVLAWFSLIHAGPREVPGILRRFADAIRPGGGLALGFFSGDALQPFEHRVATAWAWPMADVVRAVEEAGFQVAHTDERPTPNGRTAAALIASRHP
jgi:SAM-dependent methyltransferase